jgi:hypothetical protein
VTVLVATKNLHSLFEAVCAGVTVVKVFHGIKVRKKILTDGGYCEKKSAGC